ncbi:MAG: acetolactate synthase small subunit [Candidatus Marinimicrobia bacterium]|nr:acetolactate synthase small subunit [Candidatus Neomarinimicrobiota bacterium]MCF7828676.1 acetolactate synthase small subunit [Candidatus Neomarinimicrobiota bacterium]MCF7880417.1 acetolactate synthase small subunit [Candidatus Neomarinimicrobiota bacterium]
MEQTAVETSTKKHTISVYVKNNFNALSRIVGLFSGRGFDIDSISFGQGQEPGMARITITTHGDEQIIEQITKQLHKVVDVLKVQDLTYDAFVERELALIKVNAPKASRSEIMQIVNVFRAKIIDISPESMTVEATGSQDKVNAALGMLKQFGIVEVARTGSVALKREFHGQT